MSEASTDNVISETPTAEQQTEVAPSDLLNSANCGVIVERVADIKSEMRSEGRTFARNLATYINETQKGIASVFVYEETFGKKDRIHWMIHMRSLRDYERMLTMGTHDEKYRNIFTQQVIPEHKGGGTWDRIFIDGSMRESVIMPQFWGMYGTAATLRDGRPSMFEEGLETVLPAAHHQCDLPQEKILHSGNCGAIIHRSAQLAYEFRSEGRQFAREALDAINEKGGEVTGFLYEEAFGEADRIHWLLHMKSVSSYYWLIRMHAMEEKVRDIFFRDRIPAERGGGNWSRMFVPGSMVDVCLTPQHWGMYATKK
ncbi:MAG: DUF6039 family protein [Myxococcota bacterium]